MTVNASTFRLVAGGLVLILVTLVAGIIVLAGLHDDIPTILENLATGALTALAALLVSPHNPDEPVAVQVADQPVAVTAAKPRRKRGDAGLTAVGVLLAVLVVIVAFSLFGALHSPLFLLLLILCLVVLL